MYILLRELPIHNILFGNLSLDIDEHVTLVCKFGNGYLVKYRPFFHIEYKENIRRGSQFQITVKIPLFCKIFGYFGSMVEIYSCLS